MWNVSRRMTVPAPQVWEALVDLDVWPRWGPTVRGAELDDGGRVLTAGATGRVWTAVGVPLPFRVTEFVAQAGWSWAVAGVAATSHRVRADIGQTELTFGVPWWAPDYLPVCAYALGRVEAVAREA